jgi:hypothetical protein
VIVDLGKKIDIESAAQKRRCTAAPHSTSCKIGAITS